MHFGNHCYDRSLPYRAPPMNPIEHRLFSEISKNWTAEPLDSYEECSNSFVPPVPEPAWL